MLNQVVTVGRIYELKDNILTLAVNSSFKNAKGEYDTYKIRFIVKDNIFTNVKEYCSKGDIVGVKGHIENHNQILAEKITFLTSKKSDE